ncbi:alpha/beta fold hydrolase [uncultured Shimia sp.]|uniref:alpha/beta hydrolase n=1 Tax=uncultured Shimia sp. TaxID=573152 RepID=UPI002629483F|nr:alpha/beta fold hydrolase [uncultured Shimia sp.]
MRAFGRLLGRLLLVVVLCVGAVFVFGPYEQISLTSTVQDADIGADVDAYFAAQEARFEDITPGTEKRVIWHAERGEKTPVVLVYLHGFSATSEEIRPVPDRVAEALGANLVYTRLQGHGRDGAALAEATVQAWVNDVAEALHVARRVGDEVVVMGTSTGGTLMAALADNPEAMADVKGMILVAPNFGIKSPFAKPLTWPAARYWVPVVAGANRVFEPTSEAHAKYWTTAYPTVAAMQMAAMVKAVYEKDHGQALVPALFWFSDGDQVVTAARTHDVAARWGAEATVQVLQPFAESDPRQHVIAGDIRSPAENDRAVESFVRYFKGLGG